MPLNVILLLSHTHKFFNSFEHAFYSAIKRLINKHLCTVNVCNKLKKLVSTMRISENRERMLISLYENARLSTHKRASLSNTSKTFIRSSLFFL